MPSDYKNKLFTLYNATHVVFLDQSDNDKLRWFSDYVKNYIPHLPDNKDSNIKILEIGCNKGFLLHTLQQRGYKNLFGIDLSPDDVIKAKLYVPDASIECVDAFEYLKANINKFDIIILKAVLEHIDKVKIFVFMEAISSALSYNGKVIIDVPNMDWLFASHERYMDFTHETGFTKESLGQILRSVFDDVNILPVDHYNVSSIHKKILKKLSRTILTKIFSWADIEGASNPIWARSIIGVGKKRLSSTISIIK